MGRVGQSGRVVTGRAEPRFDIDYKYGHKGEVHVAELLENIASGNGRVEVKRKRYVDMYFYVETHCDKGRTGVFAPSGISVSTADAWVFVLADTGMSVVFPAETLRVMLDDASSQDRQEDDGNCPTRGKLVNFAAILFREKQRRVGVKAAAPAVAKPDPVVGVAQQQHEKVGILPETEITWGF